jgi:serine protease Do
VFNELREHGWVRQTSVGPNPQTITPTLAAGLRLPEDWGVIISDVSAGGPADKAGLKPCDILVSMDGRPMDSLAKFSAFVYLHPKDVPMQMEVLRGNQTVKLSIDVSIRWTFLSALIASRTWLSRKNGLVADLGMFIVDLVKRIASVLLGLRSQSGVVVAAVLDYEPPISADLAAGDVIRSFNGQSFSTVGELRKNLNKLKPGDAAVLEVERQGVVRFVAFEME